MKIKNLNFLMLPKEIQEKCNRKIPQLCWRRPSLYSLLGQIQVLSGKKRDANDPSWLSVEKLGSEIFEWIAVDKDRLAYWDKLCEAKGEVETPFWHQ